METKVKDNGTVKNNQLVKGANPVTEDNKKTAFVAGNPVNKDAAKAETKPEAEKEKEAPKAETPKAGPQAEQAKTEQVKDTSGKLNPEPKNARAEFRRHFEVYRGNAPQGETAHQAGGNHQKF